MTYDGNHNLTYDNVNTLTYDVENRLIEAENAAWGTSSYFYDPLGQRKQKVVGVNSVTPVATDFVLAGGEEIADYYESSATWRLTVRGADGLPLVTVVPAAGGGSEEIVYVHHDMKGSTVALTVPGSSGPAETYTYSDYGQPQSGSWLAYQYAGYRYDSETGLYYMPARSYSPALGRFLQADPSGTQGGLNLYAYSENNPINLVDPTGLTPDGGGYTVTLSESLSTAFMGVYGVPSLIVAASAKSDPIPDHFVIDYSRTVNHGSFSYFYYALENREGQVLTGDGYGVKEHINVIHDYGMQKDERTSERKFEPTVDGYVQDGVGLDPPERKGDYTYMDFVVLQSFTVQYRGTDYNLSSTFYHQTLVTNNGAITNKVWYATH